MRIKFLIFCREIFEEVDRTPSYRSPGTFRGGVFFRKKSSFPIVFGHSTEIIQLFVEKFLSGLSQLHPTCLPESLEEKWLFVKIFFSPIVFGHWAKIFRNLSKNYRRGFWNCILRVRSIILGKITFFEIICFFPTYWDVEK